MATQVKGSVKTEFILGDPRYNRLTEDWEFYSDILGCWNKAPKGFVNDAESVPLFKGTNIEAGIAHDLVCRTNFKTADGKPITKWIAAKVYLELQYYFDHMESGNVFNRVWDWVSRGVKTSVVIVWPGYWHKFNIEATYEEIVGES